MAKLSLLQRFELHITEAGLDRYVTVHQGTAESVGAAWTKPIDFLFLDGDHSPEGARSAFRTWTPFLKPGGVVALHNSVGDHKEDGHDGFRILAKSELRDPAYQGVYSAGTTTFAIKESAGK